MERNAADYDSRTWERLKRKARSESFFQGGGSETADEAQPRAKRRESFGCEEKERGESNQGDHEDQSCGTHQVDPESQEEATASTGEEEEIRNPLESNKGELSLLEASSVREPQRKDYARRLEMFYTFVVRYELNIQKEADLDAALCEFVDHLFLEGEDSSWGLKLQAALEFERPEFSREGRLSLPRFKRAMKGWRLKAPTQTRLPMPEFLKSCISGVLLMEGELEKALFNETTFSTYARPGETLRMAAEDVVSNNKEFQHTVLVLTPLERGESSKVGQYDEVLILDDSRAPFLPRLLLEQSKKAVKAHGSNADLWPFTAAQFLKSWKAAVARLQIGNIATSPYQNRRGGASRDHLKHLRSIPAIQRRGRWSSESSARLYDKPGRLQQVVNQFGTQYMELGENIRQNFGIYYQCGMNRMPKQFRQQLRQNCQRTCS